MLEILSDYHLCLQIQRIELPRGVHGSVFIKKSNQTEFFKKKNQNRTETSSNRPVSVRFGFLEQKPVQTGFARFGSVFFSSVFPVPNLKNQNRIEPVGFLKILIGLIGFFSRFGFFGYFFSGFLGLIGFSVFLNTPRATLLSHPVGSSLEYFGNASFAIVDEKICLLLLFPSRVE